MLAIISVSGSQLPTFGIAFISLWDIKFKVLNVLLTLHSNNE
jgi:hypothetical protein